ncbi:immunity protein [Streptococcus sp. Marseille-Q8145]
MSKLFKSQLLMRVLTAQLPGVALFLVILNGEFFKMSILFQVCFAVILVGNLLLNLYFVDLANKRHKTPILSGQIFFTTLTFFMLLFSTYRTMVVSNDFQKFIALISTLVLLVLFSLLVWGIKYSKSHDRNK